jgi:hypothetical protein
MEKRIGILLCCLVSLSIGLPAYSSLRQEPHAPQATSQSPAPSDQIGFAFGGDAAEIPVDFTGRIPFLPLRVGRSKPFYFVVDSTAPVSSIDPSRAAALGMKSAERAALNLAGVSILVDSLSPLAREQFSMEVGRVHEGTLGNDFFKRVVVEIDYGRHTARLYDPSVYQYSGNGAVLPLTFAGTVPVVQAKFTEPKGKVLEASFAVNTALDASVVISDRYAESHRLFRSHWKTIPSLDPDLDESQGVVLGRLNGFQLGRFNAESAVVTFSRAPFPGDSDPKVAGEIGGGMLQRYKVIFDYPHQRMIVEPNLTLSTEEEEDKSGISVIARGAGLKSFEIVAVQPGTPAAKAGLQKGDVISGIDMDAAADLTLADVRDLLRQVGHKYNLVIDRNGETRQVMVEMRRLLN